MVQVDKDNGIESEVEESGPLLEQYKTLIRQQDSRLQELTSQVELVTKLNMELDVTDIILTSYLTTLPHYVIIILIFRKNYRKVSHPIPICEMRTL
jgi:hypothetical protein